LFAFDDPNGGYKSLLGFFMILGVGIVTAIAGIAAFRFLVEVSQTRVNDSPPVYVLTEMV
jgi:hypothetical protein